MLYYKKVVLFCKFCEVIAMPTKFPVNYTFRELVIQRYHHTDNSKGIITNYLALMLDGEARFVSAEREMSVVSGDIFFLPSGCRYHSYWHGTDTARWISISFEDFPNPAEQRFPMQIIPAPQSMRGIIRALANRKPDCAAVGQLYSLFASLMPYMETEPRSSEQKLFDRAVSFMRENPRATIAEVAKACSISESGLYAAFRASGQTPVGARQQLQIENAVNLLHSTDLTIDAVASACGFTSSAYFLRVLKKLTGKSTREIRAQTGI